MIERIFAIVGVGVVASIVVGSICAVVTRCEPQSALSRELNGMNENEWRSVGRWELAASAGAAIALFGLTVGLWGAGLVWAVRTVARLV